MNNGKVGKFKDRGVCLVLKINLKEKGFFINVHGRV